MKYVIKSDTINLQPSVLSVLIGVNDTWHEFGSQNGVAVPKYERVCREFLAEVLVDLPNVKLVLCEPFVLDCGVVVDGWRQEIDQRRVVVKKLAKVRLLRRLLVLLLLSDAATLLPRQEFGATVVEFQKLFDQAVKLAPPDYWAKDGVHPTQAGHALMAVEWRKATGGGGSPSKL